MTDTPPPSATSTSTWAAGDYPAMARRLTAVADRVVTAAEVADGTTLLDVGCGTGNAVLAAARRGALATGADPTPELLGLAVERARAEQLPIAWQPAAADGLRGSYDRVVTVFGAMYAPDARRAADALVRCCAPGGRIVSAAWTPDGFMAATNRAASRYLPPPPPGGQPPTRWGDLDVLRALFAPLAVSATVEQVRFEFPSPVAAAEFWVRTAGHLQAERARLIADGSWTALHHDLAAVFTEWNRSGGADIVVEAAYLLAVVDRPLN
ncbi:class I SAM-dependent methyltransferase [Kitasatospora acidiphila]|uniref:Class I SAM-dependent methyltransferase n=1 Tax=Kitasatospora acidiphila TaxID=2567942 RepID=A0A540WD31_9ACTN|nr:class I SAM-dependent methyltransferase [Kitasatospora acidiphila]TQF06878.1 class I SAM-dependent methyltransferase [Kitasatospora acidiphila]